MTKKRSVVVIGLGTFGNRVASELSRFGDHVLGIDANEAVVSVLAERLERVVIANACEEKALREAGVGDYNLCVVAMAEDLESNLLAVMNAKAVGVEKVWAKSASETHTRILEEIGVERVLHPEVSYADLVSQQLHNPLVKGSVQLTDQLHFAHISAPAGDGVGGSCGNDLQRGENLRCVGVLRQGDFIPPEDHKDVEDGDELLLIGSRDAMRQFADNGQR